MIKAAQKWAKALGSDGCYFLALCYIAEDATGRSLDVLREFDKARALGYVGDDAFIVDAGKLYTLLYGASSKRFGVWKSGDGHPLPLDYKLLPTEREVLRFEYTDTGGKTWAHFVVGDGSGRCVYDPEGASNCVTKGKLVSRRIIRSV